MFASLVKIINDTYTEREHLFNFDISDHFLSNKTENRLDNLHEFLTA